MRLPRPGDGLRRQDRRDAGAARARLSADPRLPGHGAAWLRLGLAWRCVAADAVELHPLLWAENPDWAYGGGLYHVQCDYRLMIDNLMDLTHETYVTPPASARRRSTRRHRPAPKAKGDHQPPHENVMAPPFWRMACAVTTSPTTCRSTGGRSAAFAAQPRDDRGRRRACRARRLQAPTRSTRCRAVVVDFITPETETSIWYFWGMARNFNPRTRR